MTVPQTNSASCEAGYGQPPRHTQFKTGQSGNPGGWPRGRTAGRVEEPALHEARRTVIVKEDGRAAPLSVIQAILHNQIHMAAGDGFRAPCAIPTVIRDAERAAALEARLAALREPVSDDDDADPEDGDDEAGDADSDEDDDADLDDEDDEDDDDDDDDDEDDGAEPEADEIDTDTETQQEDGE